jgi:hypothetical protein
VTNSPHLKALADILVGVLVREIQTTTTQNAARAGAAGLRVADEKDNSNYEKPITDQA